MYYICFNLCLISDVKSVGNNFLVENNYIPIFYKALYLEDKIYTHMFFYRLKQEGV